MIRKHITKEKLKFYLSGFGLLMVYNMLTFVFRKQMLFVDEADNLLGGYMVSKGLLVYKDFYSQHTPLMYYLCGIFSFMGAHSVASFRVYFFFFLSLIWLFMFFRYSKYFGKFTMALFPFLYIFILGYTFLGNTIVSEQLQSIALVVLFLEFLLFERTRDLKANNLIVISISIFFAVGSAIVSAFPVFVICVGVLTLELYWFFKLKLNFGKFIFNSIKRYIILATVVALPFVIIIIIYASQYLLSNAYYQIFTFNTDVYSKYNGYGTSVLKTLQMPIYMFSSFFEQVINNFSSPNIIDNIQYFIDITANFLFVWLMFKRRKKIVGVISFIFALMCGTRGYDNFHAIPYYAVTSMMIAILIFEIVYIPVKNNLCNNKNSRVLIAGASVILIASSFFTNFHMNTKDGLFNDGPPTKIAGDILKITEKDDKIYMDNLDIYMYLYTERLPASRIASLVPWFADVYQQTVIEDLKQSRPKIIVYTPELDVWGRKAKDFEPDVQNYIKNNYTQLSQSDPGNIEWIRNDYIQQARQKLGIP